MAEQQQQDDFGGLVSAYIREHGWCKGVYENKAGAVCIRGGVYRRFKGDARYRLLNLLSEKLIERGEVPNIIHWNDMPGRKVEEVLELLESVGA